MHSPGKQLGVSKSPYWSTCGHPSACDICCPTFFLVEVEGSADLMGSETGTGGFRGQKQMSAVIFFQIPFYILSSFEAFWDWGFFLMW